MVTTTTLEFLSNLKANNTKAWFDEHKKEFQKAQGDVLNTFCDVSDLETEFNYRPKTKLKEGLTKFAEWFKGYYGFDK